MMDKFAIVALCLIAIGMISCKSPDTKKNQENLEKEVEIKDRFASEKIIAESCVYHGSEKIKSASVTFDFREFHFEYLHTDSGLVRSRSFNDSLANSFEDVWSRTSLERFKNGKKIQLTEKKAEAYKSSINSVFYFAFLPKSLRDPAVNLNYLDTVSIDKNKYHKIKVTFDQEGGGEDHEDVFIYWFDLNDYSMDYLAYSYKTDGGGIRFRSFKNRRRIQGIAFQDYINYKPKSDDISLEHTDQAFEKGNLTEVSRIELENVSVD